MPNGVSVNATASRTYRYVVHSRVLDYLMCGWHIAIPDLGLPHSQYSVGMTWLCNCKMVEPLK